MMVEVHSRRDAGGSPEVLTDEFSSLVVDGYNV